MQLDGDFEEADEDSPFINMTCLTGSCLLSIDFLVYGVSFIYVISNANFSWRKFGKVPFLIISFPNLFFLTGAFGRIFAYASHPDDESCLLYDSQSVIGCITMGTKIINALLINVFMLRVFHIA